MTVHITGWEIVVRLALTLFAGGVIGLNRGEHGRPAGLRTTMLVCLAASISMIQVNLLLGASGKSSDSFIVMDLMRLPLGILSGMGFIGAGAILRRGDTVRGVTTAATLWFVTMMGLCFGGGQIGLGLAALALGFLVLEGLKFLESRQNQDRHGTLSLVVNGAHFPQERVRELITSHGLRVVSCSMTSLQKEEIQQLHYDVHWRGRPYEATIPSVYEVLARHADVSQVEWDPEPKG